MDSSQYFGRLNRKVINKKCDLTELKRASEKNQQLVWIWTWFAISSFAKKILLLFENVF